MTCEGQIEAPMIPSRGPDLAVQEGALAQPGVDRALVVQLLEALGPLLEAEIAVLDGHGTPVWQAPGGADGGLLARLGARADWPGLLAGEGDAREIRLEAEGAVLTRLSAGKLWLVRGVAAEALRARELALAHDLRAPLQALVLAADTRGAGAGEVGAHAQAMASLARLSLEHVQRLLDHARNPALQPATFDLVALLRELGQLMRPICLLEGHDLRLQLPAGPIWVEGLADSLRVILQNLLGNAARANLRGAVRLELRVSMAEDRINAVIEVADQGPGMPSDLVAALEGSGEGLAHTARSGGGYGLGLGIMAEARHALGARVSVDTAPGQGARVRVHLDMRALRPEEVAATLRTAASPAMGLGASLQGVSILAIEDNPVTLAVLGRVLRSSGAEVTLAGTGEEALVQAQTQGFDLALIDMLLPDMAGWNVAEALGGGQSGPVLVALTAHGIDELPEPARTAGFAEVLSKPVRAHALNETIARLLAARARATARGATFEAGADDAMTGAGLARAGTADATLGFASPHEERDVLLDDLVVSELIEDMGRSATLSFMRKALAEARAVLDLAETEPPISELRAKVHSAIGSSGMTGLAGSAMMLRELQAHAHAGSTGCDMLDAARVTLTAVERRIDLLAES